MKYIVKAKKTYLKSPLTAAATSVVLREFIDTKDNNLALADFGDWFVVVVKQGDTIEMIKCDAITQNADNATLDVATNGRNIDPTTPYTGYSTGEDFQAGAEVIVTNDPLTVMQFGNLNIANTWALLQTFTVAPKSSADAVASDELVRKSQLDAAVLGSLTQAPVVVPGNAGETVAEDTLVYFNSADSEWYKADADTASKVENVLLGMTRGAGTDGNSITNGITILGEHIMTGLTANTVYYASDTAGALATSAGTKEVVIGVARSTTQLYFSPRYAQQITEDEQDAMGGTSGTPKSTNKFVTENDTSNGSTKTATSISFDAATKEIRDSGNGFVTAGFRAGSSITVSGSASNNGTFTAVSVAAGVIVVAETVVNESAGATVVMTTVTANKVVRKDGNGDVIVPATPTNDNAATPKAWVLSQLGGVKVARADVTLPLSDTNENTLLSVVIPANTLSDDNMVRLRLFINEARNQAGSNLTLRFKYDDTTMVTISSINLQTLTHKGYIDVLLFADGATNAQEMSVEVDLHEQNTDSTAAANGRIKNAALGTAAEDSTSAKNLVITGQYSGSSANNVFTMSHYVVEKIINP